jgi:cardiolipin synthase
MSIFVILSHLVLVVGCLVAVSMIARVNREQRSPAGVAAWLLAMVLVPYVGVPLYLILGGRKMREMIGEKPELVMVTHVESLPEEVTVADRLFRRHGLPGVSEGNRVVLCGTDQEIFQGLMDVLDRAQKSIYITTYILGTDSVGQAVVDRLVGKAKEGVQVRFLMDYVGSYKVSRTMIRPLMDAGGKVAFFMPVLPVPIRRRANLRNHRKLVVADHKWVLSGGANLADNYMGDTPDAGRWVDLCFILKGPAALDYARVFAQDWKFASGEDLDLSLVEEESGKKDTGGAVVQVIPSGPDVKGDYLYDAILMAVFAARERLWIVTPYFVPDETLAKALQIAADRGVDVMVVVPRKSNYRLVDLARNQPLRSIEARGGRVHFYNDGMLHAKVMLMDDRLAVIGSANMDMRSLKLNYEVVMASYSRPEIQAVETWINNLHAVPRPHPEAVNTVRDFGEGLVKMLIPLL